MKILPVYFLLQILCLFLYCNEMISYRKLSINYFTIVEILNHVLRNDNFMEDYLDSGLVLSQK